MINSIKRMIALVILSAVACLGCGSSDTADNSTAKEPRSPIQRKTETVPPNTSDDTIPVVNADIAYPDFDEYFDKLEAGYKASRVDREWRTLRLRFGIDSVDDAMERLANHNFIRAESMKSINGWIMTAESGSQFHRAILQRQAEIFLPLGENAVQPLLKWLGHDQMEIRYIASYTLEQLTGLNPRFPNFATLEELDQKGWLAGTRLAYENWLNRGQRNPSIDR